MHSLKHTLVASAFLATAATASADFANITIDGDFSDWAGVSVFASDAAEGGAIDFVELKVANDLDNVYILATLGAVTTPSGAGGMYTSIDSDDSAATGFDIFGLGLVGANTSYQNDFPFTQTATSFNSGGVVNAPITANPGLFGEAFQTVEYAIPLTGSQVDASAGGYNGLVFANPTFGLLLW